MVARPAFGGSSLESAVGLLIFSEVGVAVIVGDWIGARWRAGVGGGEEEHTSWNIMSLPGGSVGIAIVSLSVLNSWVRFRGA